MNPVFNKSKMRVENGKRDTCPRCKGSGSRFGDETYCTLCSGDGEMVISKSGWMRRVSDPCEESVLW